MAAMCEFCCGRPAEPKRHGFKRCTTCRTDRRRKKCRERMRVRRGSIHVRRTLAAANLVEAALKAIDDRKRWYAWKAA